MIVLFDKLFLMELSQFQEMDVLIINLTVLKNRNYQGWLVVEAEQDPAKANPFEYAKIGYNYLSKTAKECGFNIIS